MIRWWTDNGWLTQAERAAAQVQTDGMRLVPHLSCGHEYVCVGEIPQLDGTKRSSSTSLWPWLAKGGA